MLENVIKKLFPIRDEKGQPCTFPTFASQVFFDDGSVLEGKQFGGGTATVDPLTIYPVGSIYMSANETSPASLFGGTWEQLQERFLLGAGGSVTAGDIGGKTEYVFAANIGTVDNNIARVAWNNLAPTALQNMMNPAVILQATGVEPSEFVGWNNSVSVTEHDVGSVSTKIIPPYLAVYMWKRVG